MPWMSRKELEAMGFAYIGTDLLISHRAAIYNSERISIGSHSRVDDFCVLSGKINIGRNVHIAVFGNLAGGEAGITMRDFSGLAYAVQIFAQTDDYTGEALTNPTVPHQYTKTFRAPVLIGRHVIIGAGSVVFPGVTVDDGCAIGAHSTVMSSTEPWGIYVGTPARRIRERLRNLLVLEARYLEDSPQ